MYWKAFVAVIVLNVIVKIYSKVVAMAKSLSKSDKNQGAIGLGYVKQLTTMAMLTAIALIIFVIEGMIPIPIPIPGVKLGLSNIITVYAMFSLGPVPALIILLMRIVLGSMFAGQIVSLMYSLIGGLFSYGILLLLKKVFRFQINQIWIAGVLCAIGHNIGQILVAIVITSTVGVVVYLPVLMITGTVAGLCTGLISQWVVNRLDSKNRRL